MILKNGVGGAVLEGIDPESSRRVTDWPSIWVEPPLEDLQKKNSYWIWLGKQLADKLQVKPGDSVDVMVVDGQAKRIVPFVVTAITKFGIYDHDLHYARVDLRALDEIFKRQNLEPFYKCRVQPGANVAEVAARIREQMGKVAIVKQWSDINQNVFLAVRHQKHLLFLILEIVVALAAMNVVNLLMMSSHHRRRDVAIWRAMGMRLRRVVAFFVLQGATVGLVGIGFGIGLGYLACFLIETFQPSLLSEEVYNVTRLPLRVELPDVAAISLAGFLLCVVFSLIPAIGAAVTRPVKALRYE
jgi:lipoprotein-releasing system permease protein